MWTLIVFVFGMYVGQEINVSVRDTFVNLYNWYTHTPVDTHQGNNGMGDRIWNVIANAINSIIKKD